MSYACRLCDIAHGGQVLLSERAWEAVCVIMANHPGAAYAINLGSHIIDSDFPDPTYLMEVRTDISSWCNVMPLLPVQHE